MGLWSQFAGIKSTLEFHMHFPVSNHFILIWIADKSIWYSFFAYLVTINPKAIRKKYALIYYCEVTWFKI